MKYSLSDRFSSYVKEHRLFRKGDLLLLAVSGGADSVALAELCFLSGYRFEIAHCNFQLRGEESERDEKFVRSLAERYGVPLHCRKFDTEAYADEHKVSIQVAARELRYRWFDELMDSMEPPVWLLTAHHAEDNVETLLMNFFKGTGIQGLQGIRLKSGRIIRPLLFARKQEILDFLKERNLSFVEDSSNLSEKYTRNYFRHTLIPGVRKVFPEGEHNLEENLRRFGDIEILYQQSVERIKKKLVEQMGNEIYLPVLKLQKMPAMRTVLYEVVKDYGFSPSQLDDIAGLLTAENGKYVKSDAYRIIKNRGRLIIAPLAGEEAGYILIEEGTNSVRFPQGKLTIRRKPWKEEDRISSDPDIALLDASNIRFPLLLRKWRQGDYFYPLGMRKKKKVSRFMIDEKLSPTEKEKLWILESRQRIMWLAGLRIDDRFKVTASTKEVLEVYFTRY
ncbi:MAG: tRNA lysidine(34) synthetase TilS [Chitinophagaceae bacterium]|nr:tRNA lysidine(34) synthetase TilS [Chitinophagaceae bacterium]